MKCPVCSSPNVYRHILIDDVQIFQCRKCLLAFVDPKTPRKNTGHIYEFADYQKREAQFRKRYENTIRLLKKYAPGKKVLEVGAGFGLLSSILSNKGYEVDALEPDVIPHYLKDLPVSIIKKAFDPFAQSQTKKYDSIFLYDVLEHVDEPKKTILLFKKLLKKNGIVFIQTPNYLSSMATMVKEWSWWMVEDHRFFFSKHSLALLFSKKTWKNRLYTTYEEWIDFKKNLDGNFIGNKLAKYIFFAWWTPYYFLFRKLIWMAGKGGLIVTIYQKK
jgi:2-polyprenyl-3-methyl-5-hydroxy-6-metoxy-1,4-benzoquinol methylase